MTLLSVADAQKQLLALGTRLPPETVAASHALHRYLAAPLIAECDHPGADVSAMDGYAIRFSDLPGPWRLSGESAAGEAAPSPLARGSAMRISTGAAVPEDADTIVIQEHVEHSDGAVTLIGAGPEKSGAFVRRRGADFIAGATLAQPGARITPALVGLAALSRNDRLAVTRKPRVGLLATGNEVANGTLADANTPMLAAMLRSLPVEIVTLEVSRDDRTELAARFEAARGFDIMVTSGGASVGDHDLVGPVLLDLGAQIDFWRVAMKPGKPLLAGKLGETIVLGLPGNPVSAYVTALLFLLPLVRAMLGARDPLPARRTENLLTAIPATSERQTYLRAVATPDGVAPLPGQDSAMLHELARADRLIVRPPLAPAVAAGERVETIVLDPA